MSRTLSCISAILIFCASQHCVAERIHDHDGALVNHHHHSAGHQHEGNTDQTSHHSGDDNNETTCFRQIAPSLTKIGSLTKFLPVPAKDFAGYIKDFLRMAVLEGQSERPPPLTGDRLFTAQLPIFSLQAAPNAPPISFI